MEHEKRKKAQRLAYRHLLQSFGALIDSPIYTVFGPSYRVGMTTRMRANVYKMPILYWEDETVGIIVVDVKMGKILSCTSKEEAARAAMEITVRLNQLYLEC